MNIYEELQWRDLIEDCTSSENVDILVEGGKASDKAPGLWHRKGITLYCGFDPTADSLHVGNLVPLLALRRFQDAGHFPIAVAGGATGSIGDPSGKTQERQLLTREVLEHNISRVKEQLKRLLKFEGVENKARLVDNASWTMTVSYLDFLRNIGKHFSVNQMVAKESVRARMDDREAGISYTEFSYMLLQAFDFMVLCRDYNCELQIGGSDQWGNITAGIDLIRKKLGKTAYGLTLPLITNADGTKFGKTEAGAVWLDPKRTSVYKFYQFWVNTDDHDVIRYLKYFTFLSKEEIESLEKLHAENPGAREAHKALAKAATELIHGREATEAVQMASEALFGTIHREIRGATDWINPNVPLKDLFQRSAKAFPAEMLLENIAEDLPKILIKRSRLEGAGWLVVEALVCANLCASKGQARKEIEGGGIYVNNEREPNVQRSLTANDLLDGKHILLRKGKKNYVVVVVE